MNKFWRKAGILAAIFVVALLVFSKTLNHEPKDMTADMEAAGLPVVYMMQDTTRLGELHGYVTEMEVETMGSNITPLEEDNVVPILVETYGNKLEKLSYEVRSVDGQRLIQADEVALEMGDGIATARLDLQDLLQAETEYALTLTLHQENEQIYYYTKLMREDGCDSDECVAFVLDFHKKTLDKEQYAQLSTYMEPNSEADNTTLQYVTIHNRLRQVAWADMEVTEVTEPILAVQEMNQDYNVILLTTTVSAVNDSGTTDYYNVQEYYKVRKGYKYMYLMDFSRQVEEIFLGNENAIYDQFVQLGIRSEEVDYWSNETGTNVCFVQQGDLWNYNQTTNQLVQVYSFRSDNTFDVRENYGQHDIRIINADETGGIDFIVYGYMNRGEHEGKVGISVCHFDSVTNTVEEMLFLPSTLSYQALSDSISELLYINDEGVFYLMLNDAIYAIDLDTKKYEVFLDNLVAGSCQTSEDGRYIAWVAAETMNMSETMTVMDLNTGEKTEVSAPEGVYLKPMEFIDTDCIYGYADKNGATPGMFKATELKIGQVEEGQIVELTSYEKNGYWISGVEVSGGTLWMSLTREGEAEPTLTDTITNKELQESKQAQVETFNSDIKQRQVRLVLSESIADTRLSIKTPKLMLSEDSTTLILDETVFE